MRQRRSRGNVITTKPELKTFSSSQNFCRPLLGLVDGYLSCRTIVRAALLFFSVLFPFASAYSQGNEVDYSKFLHTSQRHASIACVNCHRRNDNSAQPTFPGHKDCTSCHLSQFTTPNVAMCSICHTGVSGTPPPMRAFTQEFKEGFNVKFDHAQHMTGSGKPKNGCTACHGGSLRRASALSIPTGISAHNGCYTCHTPGAQSNGRDISSCGVCHAQKAFARTPTDSPAYRIGFSHAQHSTRQRLGCADCHNYTAGLPQRCQVSSSRALEHFPTGNSTCATCHNGLRSLGAHLDFKNCRPCHTGQSFRVGA